MLETSETLKEGTAPGPSLDKPQLTERELVTQVFSLSEPNSNQLRLHFPGEKSSKTWRSRQEGLHLLAQGVFAGIRNVATHTDDEWSEQVALEHLAVLSVVARWADETEVVRCQAVDVEELGG